MTKQKMGCPECGSVNLATIELITGLADMTATHDTEMPDDLIERDYTGSTEMLWDTAKSIGVHCRTCRWESGDADWPTRLVAVGVSGWVQRLATDVVAGDYVHMPTARGWVRGRVNTASATVDVKGRPRIHVKAGDRTFTLRPDEIVNVEERS
jgi:hypothetical protein